MIIVTDLEGNKIIVNINHIVLIVEQDCIINGETKRVRVINLADGNNTFPIKDTIDEIDRQIVQIQLGQFWSRK